MHYTFHLTNQCNMRCKYCYVDSTNNQTMTRKVAKDTVDYIVRTAKEGEGIGIVFFGGEPLLCKEIIKETVSYCKIVAPAKNLSFHYKITTNGLLLDRDFMRYASENRLFIAISHDGSKEAHDKNRVDIGGEGTYDRLADPINQLLKVRPYTPVMMTVDTTTVECYEASVRHLYDMGFRYIICSMNYDSDWDERTLEILKKQYILLSQFYYEKMMAEDKLYLSPFEVKISSHIHQTSFCSERCELGKKQVSISPAGEIYPCVQFVYDEEYQIGDIYRGINSQKQLALYKINEDGDEACRDCVIKERCNHYCACLNKQVTGSINKVAPSLCAHERIILPIADRLAERLMKKRNPMFIQKQYNDMYPFISYIEDLKH